MKIQFEWPNTIKKTHFSQQFIQGMLNRVAVGSIRYGDASTKMPKNREINARNAFKRYVDTGNTEFLIDVANYAMLEFQHPSVKGAGFKPSDSDPTPSIAQFFHRKGEE